MPLLQYAWLRNHNAPVPSYVDRPQRVPGRPQGAHALWPPANPNRLADEYEHHLGFSRRLVDPRLGVRPMTPGHTKWPYRPVSATAELNIVGTISSSSLPRPTSTLPAMPELPHTVKGARSTDGFPSRSTRNTSSFGSPNRSSALLLSGHPSTLAW